MAGTAFNPYAPEKSANSHDLVSTTVANFVSGKRPGAQSATGAAPTPTPAETVVAPSPVDTANVGKASDVLAGFREDSAANKPAKRFLGM